MPKPDPSRERYWRAIIAESSASGLSHAEYCRRQDINVIQMRNWMKRLKERDAKAQSKAPAQRTARVPRRPCKRDPVKPRSISFDPTHSAGVEFAEVRLVNTAEPAPKKVGIAGPVEIAFASGLTLRILHGASLETLPVLITLLENR